MILNSRLSLKSLNFCSVMMSTQPLLLVISPSSTLQHPLPFSERSFHPVRSLPLKSWIGVPHFGLAVGLSAGARTPDHFSVAPSSPLVEPASFSPVKLPSKTRSTFWCSYCGGRLNLSFPSLNSICLIGRALPKCPTKRPCNFPSASVTSSHEL